MARPSITPARPTDHEASMWTIWVPETKPQPKLFELRPGLIVKVGLQDRRLERRAGLPSNKELHELALVGPMLRGQQIFPRLIDVITRGASPHQPPLFPVKLELYPKLLINWEKSEAGSKSETSSGSPGSGIDGRKTSHASASARDSPHSAGTAHSADSINYGERFIQRITGQASNAGSSNPPTDFVLCIDGTGNDMVNEIELKNTNIARITDLINFGTHKGRMTLVAYQQGLGNEGKSRRNNESLLAGWAAKLHARFDELWPTAGKIATLVAINYAYISLNVYPNKDRIFLFGFSRGAYVSQITAALVADLGTLSNEQYVDKVSHQVEHSEVIRDIVHLWLERRGTMSAKMIKSELGPFGECLIPARIQFLGLFDMVASVGAPDVANTELQDKAFQFAESIHNRPNILNASHAVAISEHRNQFKPVLWKQKANDQSVSQVWFPGYHTSIGGGTKTQGLMIYHITLVWMLSKCIDLHHVIDKKELQKLIAQDAKFAANRQDEEEPFVIPDSRKRIWKIPGLGEHIRTEFGLANIDLVHRVCDEDKWIMRCAPKMPDIDGTEQHPIQTKYLLQQKRIDKPNAFELEFYDGVMFNHGPGQRSTSVSPPKRAGRGMARVLDS
ncbi:hypothetical protein DHEL01_v210227 [Diaporthe helianthi]|uniref:T6SS Phospholipase effector Tle1-like catalytic domain-containing protein n=1 Tax=Diaporthe helianthi TaxID=158607 RepID=A0A2P5HM76_DIAHE|nr:hypothetical protein DHEL01_v210227 [Diaporthe helianthi]